MANERVCAVCRVEAHSKHRAHAASDTNYWMWEFHRLILAESELSAGSQSRRQTQAKTPSENENTTLQGFQHRVDKSNRVSGSPKKKMLTPPHATSLQHDILMFSSFWSLSDGSPLFCADVFLNLHV